MGGVGILFYIFEKIDFFFFYCGITSPVEVGASHGQIDGVDPDAVILEKLDVFVVPVNNERGLCDNVVVPVSSLAEHEKGQPIEGKSFPVTDSRTEGNSRKSLMSLMEAWSSTIASAALAFNLEVSIGFRTSVI